MSNHKRIYVTSSHTKIFGNIRRVGKGFSRRETPLFPTMMVQAQEEIGEGLANPTDPHHTLTIIQPSTSQPQKKQKPRKPKRKDIKVPQPGGPTDNVAYEAVYEEMDDSLKRAATTATSLDAEQDRGNITKTQSKATLNEPSSLGTSSGSGLRPQKTMGDTIAQIGFKNVSKTSNDSLPIGVNTPRSDEDSLKLKELIEFVPTYKIELLIWRKLRALKLRRLQDSSDKEVSTHFDADTYMFGVHYLVGNEVVVESKVVVKAASTIPVSAVITTTTVITDDEITFAKALAELRTAKLPITTATTTIIAMSTRPRAKGLVIHEEEQATTPTVSSQQPS
ncbi:hypothetical protein Tco_1352245 [Tanacetum coccineum]